MLEETGRAPLLLVLPLVVPEGEELLLVLLGDPEPELLELPLLPEEVEGGAREGGGRLSYVNHHQKQRAATHFQRP